MSKKVLTTMKDENSDLKKQIGCISGFFQLFDRHRFLTDQRGGSSQSQNRPTTPGPGGTSNHIIELNRTMQKAPAKNMMVARENQQFSTESSVTSMSTSSCSSSMSSLEFNRTIQMEQPSNIQIKIPENSNSDAAIKQLDFYDVVKDSMHREAKGLAVKTAAKEEKKGRVLKCIDSPRPLQPPKSANEPFHGLTKSHNRPWDSPRLSYDGRDMHDTFKSGSKHKELPRLSLDSRQGSFKGINEGTKSNNLLKGPQKGYGGSITMVKQIQESETPKRPSSSVVAKLMGLETFAGGTSSCTTSLNETLVRPSMSDDYNQHRSSVSPRTGKESTSLRSWSDGSVSNASQGSQLEASKGRESSIKASNTSLSVYGEIEKRMANLEFKNSGKDLRALKQILDAMQRYKDSLDITRDQVSDSPSHSRNNSSFSESSKVQSPRFRQKDPTSVTAEESNSSQGTKSPIVIMKPAKFTRETNNPGNQTNGRLFHKHDRQNSKGISPTNRHRKESFSQPIHSAEKNNKMRTSKLMQSSKVSQVTNRENSTTNSGYAAETSSPRLQKKFGLERRSPPTSPLSDSSSNRRQNNRQPLELTSPSTTPRLKLSTLPERNERFSKLSCRRNFHHEVDVNSQNFDSKRSRDSHSDLVVLHVDHSEKNNSISIHQNGQNQNNATKEKIVTAEQPSPVSVLDATFYIEDPPSPMKKKSDISKDLDEALNVYDSSEESLEDLPLSSITTKANFSKGTNYIDLKAQNLVQILQQIDFNNEKLTNFRSSKDPDHKYISEILLASRLLGSLDSSQAFHSLAHPINPKLFLALEQIKTSKFHFNDPEKMQRKLIFDVVNDILVQKLILESSSIPWPMPNQPVGRKLKGQQLLDELCTEIDQLQHKNRNVSLVDEDEYLTSLLWEDLMHQPTIYTDSNREMPNVVLDIERLIFKDLITEVVRGEVANYPGRHCRQLQYPM
ncbi:hypothetical protein RIF29_19226 [Crotalaria pallida]|uniref:DUF4378 domain-containing protein n=1 Tax=Crotalaria pallida TaxID=3830 RepID=A0AAN9EZL7_CROPI